MINKTDFRGQYCTSIPKLTTFYDYNRKKSFLRQLLHTYHARTQINKVIITYIVMPYVKNEM